MKQGIHPTYGPVAFRDRATGRITQTRSTLAGRHIDNSVVIDGAGYPVIDVDISKDSHPFWTGTARTLDSEGRVERFARRYGMKS
jgi:large subunit ribosomal protein L31